MNQKNTINDEWFDSLYNAQQPTQSNGEKTEISDPWFDSFYNQTVTSNQNNENTKQPSITQQAGQYAFNKVNPENFSDTAARIVRGGAESYGDIADVFSKNVTAPIQQFAKEELAPKMLNEEQLSEASSRMQQENQNTINSNLREKFTNKISEVYGKDLTPTNTKEKIQNTIGNILAPLYVPGGGSIKSIKGAVKSIFDMLVKELPMATGASAALHTIPNLTEEGTLGRMGEDYAKIVSGALVGDKADKIVKGISKIPEMASNTLARGASLSTSPNKQILDLAKKYDIDLPFNVGLNGRWQNFAANNILNKSIFTSKAYENVLKSADEAMIKTVDEAIDSLGTSNLKPTEASVQYRDFLFKETEAINKEKTKLYDEAYGSLKENDKLVPQKTINAIDSLTSLLTRDIKSTDTKTVSNIIFQLGEAWGILPAKATLEEFTNSPEVVKKVMEEFKKQTPEIGVGRLVAAREELQQIYKHDPNVKGVKKQLARLVGSLTKDIQQTENKEFLAKWQEANAFYKLNVAQRIETDIAKSIMSGQAPELAFAYMGDRQGVELIQKITGNSENGKQVFDALKKAKVREIFAKSFESDGSLKVGNFANTFKKESEQELLETLFGTEQYNKLNDVAKIASAFSQSGRQLLNTSGTAITSSELGKIEAILSGISGLFGIAGNPATILPAAGYAASVNIGSRLVSTPKFVNQMHAYALARQAGKEKEAQTILRRLYNILDAIDIDSGTRIERYYLGQQLSNKNEKDEEND